MPRPGPGVGPAAGRARRGRAASRRRLRLAWRASRAWRGGCRRGRWPPRWPRCSRFEPLPLYAKAPPLLLVGPPGAGKTLTVARLAARLVLAGTAPLVVTADGRAPARPRSSPPSPGCSACTCWWPAPRRRSARALARRQGGAPVLIDTPGTRSVRPRPARGDRRPGGDRRRGAGGGAAGRARRRRGLPTSPAPTPPAAPACWRPPGSTWRGGSAACWRPPAPGWRWPRPASAPAPPTGWCR